MGANYIHIPPIVPPWSYLWLPFTSPLFRVALFRVNENALILQSFYIYHQMPPSLFLNQTKIKMPHHSQSILSWVLVHFRSLLLDSLALFPFTYGLNYVLDLNMADLSLTLHQILAFPIVFTTQYHIPPYPSSSYRI